MTIREKGKAGNLAQMSFIGQSKPESSSIWASESHGLTCAGHA